MKNFKTSSERVITIDGPAGGGKSTVAKMLAERLGFDYLDTGAMYRTVALAGLRAGVDWEKPEELVHVAETIHLESRGAKIFLDGEDVSSLIRSSEVTGVTRFSANNRSIRNLLVELQRQIATGRSLVTEGRDQGTVVFPDAFCKFYLTATPEERARRRMEDLKERGENPDFQTILEGIITRDREDSERSVGPLRQPEDAIEIISDGLTAAEVTDLMEKRVRNVLAKFS